MGMEIITLETDGVAVVSITGEIDSRTAPEAQNRMLPFMNTHNHMVLELSGLTFMSSAGLRMMLLLYRQATARAGKVALVGLSQQIKDTMEATGFLGFFLLCSTVEEASVAVKA
jgi:anti-sigma B factor antagonist